MVGTTGNRRVKEKFYKKKLNSQFDSEFHSKCNFSNCRKPSIWFLLFLFFCYIIFNIRYRIFNIHVSINICRTKSLNDKFWRKSDGGASLSTVNWLCSMVIDAECFSSWSQNAQTSRRPIRGDFLNSENSSIKSIATWFGSFVVFRNDVILSFVTERPKIAGVSGWWVIFTNVKKALIIVNFILFSEWMKILMVYLSRLQRNWFGQFTKQWLLALNISLPVKTRFFSSKMLLFWRYH